jgi:ankyrin repeat protein
VHKRTPLHYACSKNNTNLKNKCQLNAIKTLVKAGAELDVADDEKLRPIHYICSDMNNMSGNEQLDAIRMLIEKGVELDVADHNGMRQFITFVQVTTI